ncbi:hypothetical protein [Paraburkholderia agricolaris]|uniref:hypothetical protein n=1 Tax=Paraburkholderia agricolaris TaxID=2152888 RepID=UPI001290F9BD|nr:hypothetical protein [Paraburkholderia agricolaris]
MTSFHRGDWLAVVQAITATFAVVAAFAVVFVQNWLERRRQRLDAIRLMRFAYSYVESAHAHAEMFESMIKKEANESAIDFRRMKLVMTQLLREMNSVPTLNLPTVLSARIFGMAKDQTERLIELIESESKGRTAASYITFPSLVRTLREVRDQLHAENVRVRKGGR